MIGLKLTIALAYIQSIILWYNTRILLWIIRNTLRTLGFIWKNITTKHPPLISKALRYQNGKAIDMTDLVQIAFNWLSEGDKLNMASVRELIGDIPSFISFVHNELHQIITIKNRDVLISNRGADGQKPDMLTRSATILFNCLDINRDQQ